MTGGRLVVLGTTGKNFAAGMSGGIAYVYDPEGAFPPMCNTEMVDLVQVPAGGDEESWLHDLVAEHAAKTGSSVASSLVASDDAWRSALGNFVKVYPRDYRRMLEASAEAASQVSASSQSTSPPTPTYARAFTTSGGSRRHFSTSSKRQFGVHAGADAVRAVDRSDPMDKAAGFMKYDRRDALKRDPKDRASDWEEINDAAMMTERATEQSARCMDCGTPFCQSHTGCPIGNVIPKFNDLVYRGQWYDALLQLEVTNNFPEITGRVCPAPCEGACTLGITDPAVSIKSIEAAIADKGFEEGWVQPTIPERRSGKRVAIVGSGPAGMAAAAQLNSAGHEVTVYERNDRAGGLLTYGIPNMKLEKGIVRRRLELLEASGIDIVTGVEVGADVALEELLGENDAVLLTTGATVPRDLDIEGRDLDGIHVAMDYLEPTMRSLLADGEPLDGRFPLDIDVEEGATDFPDAKGKKVVVIGGGDTGVDCIATAIRQHADDVTSFEILDQPPEDRASNNPWPTWPRISRTDYAHSEYLATHGKDPRKYSIMAKRFISDGAGRVAGVETVGVEWTDGGLKEIEGSEEIHDADLVFLALGFSGPERSVVRAEGSDDYHVSINRANNFQTARGSFFRTDNDKLYVAGDCRRGQSLVVWAIDEGRQAAREIDIALMGQTALAVSGGVKQLKFTASLNSSRRLIQLLAREVAMVATASIPPSPFSATALSRASVGDV